MRFIVDFFRYVILAGIGLTIITIVFVSLHIATANTTELPFGSYFFLFAAALLVAQIMALGATATIISIHDRHCEIVAELRNMNDTIRSKTYGE